MASAANPILNDWDIEDVPMSEDTEESLRLDELDLKTNYPKKNDGIFPKKKAVK